MKKIAISYIALLGLSILINVEIKNLLFFIFFFVFIFLFPLILSMFLNWLNDKISISKTLFVINMIISCLLSGTITLFIYAKHYERPSVERNEEEIKLINIALLRISKEIPDCHIYDDKSFSIERFRDQSGKIINYKIRNLFTCEDYKGRIKSYKGIIVINNNNEIVEVKITPIQNVNPYN